MKTLTSLWTQSVLVVAVALMGLVMAVPMVMAHGGDDDDFEFRREVRFEREFDDDDFDHDRRFFFTNNRFDRFDHFNRFNHPGVHRFDRFDRFDKFDRFDRFDRGFHRGAFFH